MDKKTIIAVDAMGGENSPDKILNGISLFVIEKDNKGIEVQDYPTVDGFKAGEVILNDVHNY